MFKIAYFLLRKCSYIPWNIPKFDSHALLDFLFSWGYLNHYNFIQKSTLHISRSSLLASNIRRKLSKWRPIRVEKESDSFLMKGDKLSSKLIFSASKNCRNHFEIYLHNVAASNWSLWNCSTKALCLFIACSNGYKLTAFFQFFNESYF